MRNRQCWSRSCRRRRHRSTAEVDPSTDGGSHLLPPPLWMFVADAAASLPTLEHGPFPAPSLARRRHPPAPSQCTWRHHPGGGWPGRGADGRHRGLADSPRRRLRRDRTRLRRRQEDQATSAISSWIRLVFCSWPTFTPPTSTTRSARGRWSRPRRHRPCRVWTWSGPTGPMTARFRMAQGEARMAGRDPVPCRPTGMALQR